MCAVNNLSHISVSNEGEGHTVNEPLFNVLQTLVSSIQLALTVHVAAKLME